MTSYFDWEAGYIYQNSENQQSQTGNYNAGGQCRHRPVVLQPGHRPRRVRHGSRPGRWLQPDLWPGAGGCLPWNPAIPYGRTGDG
jgi:iron complex outermembrane receptor protein